MKTASGMLIGSCVAVMIALLGTTVAGSLTAPYVIFGLAIGALFLFYGAYVEYTEWPLRESVRLSFWDVLAIAAFSLFALRSFLWVVYVTGNDLKIGNPNNLGDLPLHWQYILYLAHGANFWPDNPITAHGNIGYPFGVDMLNSMLVLCGLDVIRGFVWVGLIFSAITCAMLFRWGRAFVIAGFLFNGGFSGIDALLGWKLDSWQTVDWKSIPLALFVPQRGFLYAFPVGLLLLDSWRTRICRIEGVTIRRAPLPVWAEVVFYSTMPLYHLHTFLFLTVMLVWFFVFGRGQLRRHWLVVVGGALLPATMLVLWITDFFNGAGGIFGFKPGWMQGDQPFFQYWFTNFGIFLPLLLWLCFALGWSGFRWPQLPMGERVVGRMFVFPAIVIFGACCLFRFAYWEWDNTKLMAWSYLTVLPFLWDVIFRPLSSYLRVPMLVLLFFSGFVALMGGLNMADNGMRAISRSEIDEVACIIDPIPPEARFATAPDYDHPLVFLGRKLAMGYPGHFSGHGLPLAEVQADFNTLMRGDANWRAAAKRLEVDYVFWGTRERATFPDSTLPWIADSTIVSRGKWGELYRLPKRQ